MRVLAHPDLHFPPFQTWDGALQTFESDRVETHPFIQKLTEEEEGDDEEEDGQRVGGGRSEEADEDENDDEDEDEDEDEEEEGGDEKEGDEEGEGDDEEKKKRKKTKKQEVVVQDESVRYWSDFLKVHYYSPENREWLPLLERLSECALLFTRKS